MIGLSLVSFVITFIKERQSSMGGNAFEDTEPLSPQEYAQITAQIISIVAPICIKIEPYIPLPQKDMHGDIDFLLILQPAKGMDDLRQLLHVEEGHFIKNNNMTANSVYRKKQVDFNVAADEQQFLRCRFYKSYGGIGAFLGLFLPSKFVKLNEEGLICCAYQQHLKLQFLVCNDVHQILIFYGLDPQRYELGFKTRRQLFEYLRDMRFLQEQQFISHTTKHQTKLMKAFQEFIKQQYPRKNPHYAPLEDPASATLQYFKRAAQFEKAWIQKLSGEARKKERQNKWNGMHVMKLFQVNSKQVNALKLKFQTHFSSKQQYQAFIDENSFQAIAQLFAEVCHLQPPPAQP